MNQQQVFALFNQDDNSPYASCLTNTISFTSSELVVVSIIHLVLK